MLSSFSYFTHRRSNSSRRRRTHRIARYIGRTEHVMSPPFSRRHTSVCRSVRRSPCDVRGLPSTPVCCFSVPAGFPISKSHIGSEQCRRAAARRPANRISPPSEVLVERDAAGVEGLAAANRAAQRTNAASVDADTGAALRNVFHDSAGGGVDGIQTVATLDQYAGAN